MSIKPFTVKVPKSTLDDLQHRLEQTRWTDEVNGAGWGDGANLEYMQQLVNYWQVSFDWRKQEKKLNKFKQFTTTITIS